MQNIRPLSVAVAIALCVCVLFESCYGADPGKSEPNTNNTTQATPTYIENKGQWDSRVQFLSQSPGVNQWITSNGPVLDFYRCDSASSRRGVKEPQTRHIAGQIVRVSFVGGRGGKAKGENPLPGRFNYLIGNDRRKWARNVRRYSAALANGPYEGISTRYYFDKGSPRYDIIVNPGADPTELGLKFEGVNAIQVLANGNLAMETAVGRVEERGLTAYQNSAVGQVPVSCRIICEGNVVRFDPGAYDPTKPLIIDPLVYSTVMGGSGGSSYGSRVAITPSGNTVVAGNTWETNFPVTTGAYQEINDAGYDPYTQPYGLVGTITEFNSTGSKLVFCTYLGGSLWTAINGLALDGGGDPVVAGYTTASDFPTTKGAFEVALDSGASGFVTKLSATGSDLIFSTYLGSGQSQSSAQGVALDTADNVYVDGCVFGAGFPTSAGAFQQKPNGVATNVYVTKLNSTGSGLIYSTILGGSSYDYASALAIDKSGYAYVVGMTNSADFPVTPGAFQGAMKTKDNLDTGFVAKVNLDGTALEYSTYLGGSVEDNPLGMAVDGTVVYHFEYHERSSIIEVWTNGNIDLSE